MVELIVGGNDAYIEEGQTVKVTRENPYMSESGDYTMAVTLPLDIAANRRAFLNWKRIDGTKELEPLSAVLKVDSVVVIEGTAKVKSKDAYSVTLQICGARSSFNTQHGEKYIDELDGYAVTDNLGQERGQMEYGGLIVGKRGQYVYAPVFNANATEALRYIFTGTFTPLAVVKYNGTGQFVTAAADTIVLGNQSILNTPVVGFTGNSKPYAIFYSKDAPQWNLRYLVQKMFEDIGYEFSDDGSGVIWPNLYVANCVATKYSRFTLPHWTFADFLEHLENFLNCSFVFGYNGSGRPCVTLSPNNIYVTSGVEVALEVEDEFTVEVKETERMGELLSSSIAYDLPGYHEEDVVDEEAVKSIKRLEFDSIAEARAAASANPDYTALYCVGDRRYCLWLRDYAKWNQNTNHKDYDLIEVGLFSPLQRSSDNTVHLKIVPAAIRYVLCPMVKPMNPVGFVDIDSLAWAGYAIYEWYDTFADRHLYAVNPAGSAAAGLPGACFFVYLDHERQLCMPAIYMEGPGDAFGAGAAKDQTARVDSTMTAQAVIEKMKSDDSATEHVVDRIEVFFVPDDDPRGISVYGPTYNATKHPWTANYAGNLIGAPLVVPYTDYRKCIPPSQPTAYPELSLSLHPDVESSEACTLGSHHVQESFFDDRKLYRFRFLSKEIYPVDSVFVIHNRRFVCRKMELDVRDGHLDPLMTGYFYEML